MSGEMHALLRDIRHACARFSIKPTRFGIEAMRDPRLVFDIERSRRTLRPASVARVRAFIAACEA